MNNNISLRHINKDDEIFTYQLASEKLTRMYSYNSEPISSQTHAQWFKEKLTNKNAKYYICQLNNSPIGLLRFDIKQNYILIGITLSIEHRGKGLASKFIRKGSLIITQNIGMIIMAHIKEDNITSIKAFESAGFILNKKIELNGFDSYEYIFKES